MAFLSARSAMRAQALHPNGEPHAVLSSASAGAEDDGIRTLTLNRPAARNAISRRMLDELLEAVKQVRFDRQARALIIRTSAPGVAFCAGADLKERRKFSPAQVDVFLADLRTAFSGIERLPVPTIAAIDGLAMGGGMELALCADLRIASEDVKGLGLTETKLGIIPGAGGTQRMTRLLGPSRTKDLIYTARLLTAAQAHNLGLVDYLASANSDNNSDDVQCGSAYNKALEIAQQIAKNGPLAVRAAKLAIDKGQAMDTETGLDFERACYNTVMHTKDRLEGLKAFAEKRAPKYIGE
ncbi:ClpP/crotonase [Tilletiaria anomala UBC 951]|uniref:ClpP/crotonase n=1 Tax=Tilletiaria anomala (strain ATCC 24038 / CBS 436.72 / UBC 951) TaxID=1037660 RepID=A0A066V8S8_TILAU|nr:ClpP/crotonase [Tilletiaria anomala UBC 951]KDN36698.1 ClpP/crotonase [Tilletiaria anomala UBC 951]